MKVTKVGDQNIRAIEDNGKILGTFNSLYDATNRMKLLEQRQKDKEVEKKKDWEDINLFR